MHFTALEPGAKLLSAKNREPLRLIVTREPRSVAELATLAQRAPHSTCTGKPFKVLPGMRPREAWANRPLCVASAFSTAPDSLTFSSDPLDGDGTIHDTRTGGTWQTEHVMVPLPRSGRVEDMKGLIPNAIEKKWRKGGSAHARGKTLVLFREAAA